MLTERSGAARFYGGEPLHLNRESGVYFNDVGLAFVSPDLDLEDVLERVQELGFTSP